MRRWTVAVLALGALGACGRESLLGAAGDVVVSPSALAFPSTFVGATSRLSVDVDNAGSLPAGLTLASDAPFELAATALTLAPGGHATVEILFAPADAGAFAGQLRLAGDLDAGVALSGAGLAPFPCDGAPGCSSVAFDPAAGTCVVTPLPNGTPCTAACLVDAQCLDGACVGAPASCDDGDACTVDACESDGGCAHVPRLCPPAVCQVATCDPALGCGLAPARDGTLCGPQTCDEAWVCIAGACVNRALPEGAPCEPESPCSDTGVCVNHVCQQVGPGQTLAPVWSYTTQGGDYWDLWFYGVADDQANLYWVDMVASLPGNMGLMSATRDGAIRYTQPINFDGGFGDCQQVWGGMLIWDDELVLDCIDGWVMGFDAASGTLRWRADLGATANWNDPGNWTVPLGMARAGSTLVVNSARWTSDAGLSGAWVSGLDAQSGAVRWSHLYEATSYEPTTDEQGNIYFVSFVGDQTLVNSLSADGAVRWVQPAPPLYTRPISDDWPTFGGAYQGLAVFGDGLCGGNILDAATGLAAVPSSAPCPPNALGDSYPGVLLSSSDLFHVDMVTYPSVLAAVQLPSELPAWNAALPQPTQEPWASPTAPVLLSDNSVLVCSGDSLLQRYAPTGQLMFAWPLAGWPCRGIPPLAGGYWFGFDGMTVSAFDLNGLSAADSGWLTYEGTMRRDNRPR